MRIAWSAALTVLGIVVGATGVEAEAPQDRWSGFHLGIAAGFADVSSDAQLSAGSTTTTSKTCQIVPNDQAGAILQDNFNVACVGDQNPEQPALNALFANANVGTMSGPFDISSTTVNQLTKLLSGDSGWLGMAFVGYDQQISKSLIIGAFADVSVTDAETTFSATAPVAGVSGKLNFDFLATVGGRLGWIVPTGNALLYVYGGYTYADAGRSEATVTTGQGTTIASFEHFQGFSLGGGAEVQLGAGWFGRLDYRYTHLNGEKFGFSHSSTSTVPDGVYGACGGPNGPRGVDCQRYQTTQTATSGSVQIDPEIHSLRVALGYRF